MIKPEQYQRPSPLQENIRDSEELMKRIKQLKEGLSANQSHAKQSEQNRQKLQKYLPSENINNILSSKEDVKHNHYRLSLQNRLERLFRQEKELLKERNSNDNYSRSIASHHEKEFAKLDDAKKLRNKLLQSNSISEMQQKLKILEEKYKIIETKEQSSQVIKSHNKIKTQVQKSCHQNREEDSIKEAKDRSRSETPHLSREATAQRDERQWSERQRQLQVKIKELKLQMKVVKRNNQQILKKLENRQERRKKKHQTKAILQNILHKLEFINVEIANAKKFNEKQESKNGGKLNKHDTNKIQSESSGLIEEFQLIKLQYEHLDKERKRVQVRQANIESKLKKITQQG